MRTHLRRLVLATALLGVASAHTAAADTATVAVAANFKTPIEALQRAFERGGAHKLSLVAGSTGQLYAQITNGAPFDAMLAADQETVAKLVADGRGDGATRFTYAVGALVLFTREPQKFAPLNLDVLRRKDFRWLAIANPDLYLNLGDMIQGTKTQTEVAEATQAQFAELAKAMGAPGF